VFVLSKRIADLASAGLDRMFLVNSGPEAYDTVMKIALAHPLSLNTSNGPP
jgi:adenosylmethionine-8-amino-7-oxononanoate aminotransferase